MGDMRKERRYKREEIRHVWKSRQDRDADHLENRQRKILQEDVSSFENPREDCYVSEFERSCVTFGMYDDCWNDTVVTLKSSAYHCMHKWKLSWSISNLMHLLNLITRWRWSYGSFGPYVLHYRPYGFDGRFDICTKSYDVDNMHPKINRFAFEIYRHCRMTH